MWGEIGDHSDVVLIIVQRDYTGDPTIPVNQFHDQTTLQ